MNNSPFSIDYYSKENELRFINYLYSIDDFERCANEGLRAITIYPELSDEAFPLIIKSLLKEEKYGAVIGIIDKHHLDYFDSYLYSLFKLKNYKRILIKGYKNDFQMKISLASSLILGNAKNYTGGFLSLKEKDDRISKELFMLYQKENQFKEKSPILAGLFSSIIPGSGRIYAGRIADGIFSMIYILTLTYKTYYTFSQNGLSSIEGWLWGMLDLYFYVGNIYGSVVAVKIRKRDFLKKIENEIQLNITINF